MARPTGSCPPGRKPLLSDRETALGRRSFRPSPCRGRHPSSPRRRGGSNIHSYFWPVWLKYSFPLVAQILVPTWLKYSLTFTLIAAFAQKELIGLTRDCVDFENHTLRIYRQFVRIASGPGKGKMMYTPLKNGKERTITLTVTALNVLREAKRKQNEMHLRAGSSWHNEYNMIFTRSNGMFVRFKTLYVHFKAIVKRMGRPGVRFHDVRHTYATLSLQSHVDPKTLSEALGHATVAFTLDVYGHSNADMRQQAAEQLEQLICQY